MGTSSRFSTKRDAIAVVVVVVVEMVVLDGSVGTKCNGSSWVGRWEAWDLYRVARMI